MMAQITVHRNTTATEPIRRRKFIILSGGPLRLGDHRAPNTTTNLSSGQQYQDTNFILLRKYWDLLGSTWFLLKGSSYGPPEDDCFVFIKPDIKPKSPPRFHEREDVRVSAEFCRFNLLPPNFSAKVLKKGSREPLLHARSKQQILRATTIPEQRLDGAEGENSGTSIGGAFGRQSIARWKCSGGKSKEWRRRPWSPGSSVSQGVPEIFLKHYSGSNKPRRFYASKTRKEKLEHSWLKSTTTEALAYLTHDHDQHLYEEDNAVWPPAQSNVLVHESIYDRASGKPDKFVSLENKVSFELPNVSYSGAIIGGYLQLGALIEEHESPGERTYAVSDLRAPGRKLVARMYSLAEIPGKRRDARKRHMKRLIQRENVCDIREDGKRFIVYPCATTHSSLPAKQNIAHNQFQQSTWRPGSHKDFQNVTDFPPLSSMVPRAINKTSWETSELRCFFQEPPAPGVVTPPTTPDDLESPSSGQSFASKRKRRRWKKARKDRQPIKHTDAELKELVVLPNADGTSGEAALPQPKTFSLWFDNGSATDKCLESNAETSIHMVADIEGWNLNDVKSMDLCSSVDSALRAKVLDSLARREQWLIDQLDYVRTISSIISQHHSV